MVSLGFTITVVVMVEVLGWPWPAVATAVSFTLWTPVSYLVHKAFTFRNSSAHTETVVKFFLTFLTKLVASVMVVEATVHVLHLHYLVGLLLNWVVLPLITFALLKFWVFTTRPGTYAEDPVPNQN